MRCFQVTLPGKGFDNEGECYYWQPTASKARYQAWATLQDLGYDTIKFGDIRVLRAYDFDEFENLFSKNQGVGIEYLKELQKQ